MKATCSGEDLNMSKRVGLDNKSGRVLILLLAVLILTGVSGCLSLGLGSKNSNNGSEKAIDGEVAEMVKLYRMCLQKNEDAPTKAKENCGLYKDAIRALAPDNMRTIVAEVMERVRDKCEKLVKHKETDL